MLILGVPNRGTWVWEVHQRSIRQLTDSAETPKHVISRASQVMERSGFPLGKKKSCHLKCIGDFRSSILAHRSPSLEISEEASSAGQPCAGATGYSVSHAMYSPTPPTQKEVGSGG